ncbi:hypothetical protein ABEB36_005993 [Hypothenemus hampei]|uniref:G-protein coupled receptors family 1 profile domain-containing protein n=1 Tax=Hypothenemus hampei TaxID=57062 RepID=A0ABD1F040_HYPHA
MNLTKNESIDFIKMNGERCPDIFNYYYDLNIFYTPMIILGGFVGNFLSFLVLSTTHLKMRSSSYYLAALALSDSGYLVTVVVIYCSVSEFFELYNIEGFCQFVTYLSSVCSFLSVWLTVAFTTERFIAVRYPLQRQYMCTISRAKTIVFSLTFIAAITQIHVLWTSGLVLHEEIHYCSIKQDYRVLGNITNLLDTMFTCAIPTILILFMNVVIAHSVFKSRNILMQGTQEDERLSSDRVRFHHVSSQSSDSTRNSDPEYSTSSRRLKNDHYSLRRNRSTRPTSLQIQHNINKMLLVISSVFITLNFPSYVIRAMYYYNLVVGIKPPHTTSMNCAHQFAMLLFYTNFSINFLLYAVCGKSFRACLKKMLRDFCRKLM